MTFDSSGSDLPPIESMEMVTGRIELEYMGLSENRVYSQL